MIFQDLPYQFQVEVELEEYLQEVEVQVEQAHVEQVAQVGQAVGS